VDLAEAAVDLERLSGCKMLSWPTSNVAPSFELKALETARCSSLSQTVARSTPEVGWSTEMKAWSYT
jgi:hypothetical protein